MQPEVGGAVAHLLGEFHLLIQEQLPRKPQRWGSAWAEAGHAVPKGLVKGLPQGHGGCHGVQSGWA